MFAMLMNYAKFNNSEFGTILQLSLAMRLPNLGRLNSAQIDNPVRM